MWTETPPTKPGFYPALVRGFDAPEVVEVSPGGEGFWVLLAGLRDLLGMRRVLLWGPRIEFAPGWEEAARLQAAREQAIAAEVDKALGDDDGPADDY